MLSLLRFTPLLICVPIFGFEHTGWIALQGQAFPHEGLRGQAQSNLSLAAKSEWFRVINDQWEFRAEFFGRLDQEDNERSHLDIREAHAFGIFDNWEYKIGIGREYWGATEFAHLVDVINQTDAVENIDGEDKLGQPMIKASWFNEWGSLEGFILPYFRERTFPGEDGRFHFSPLTVDTNHAEYESSAEEWHTDFSLRFNGSFSAFDMGLAYFNGTNRDPLFNLAPNGKLTPYYELMSQVSIDTTIPSGDWLWKAEAYHRESKSANYVAATGGFEYTLVGIFESATDLGLLLEYIWDERGNDADRYIQNDAFMGGRIALNNFQETEILFGFVQDVTNGRIELFNTELSHRINDNLSIEVEVRAFINDNPEDLIYALRNDDYLQFELFYYF